LSYSVVKNEKIIWNYSSKKKSIRKYGINVIEAWEIGPNDIEGMAIHSDDDPLIPERVSNPPIIETLKRKFRQ
jgi:hypothetical protein